MVIHIKKNYYYYYYFYFFIQTVSSQVTPAKILRVPWRLVILRVPGHWQAYHLAERCPLSQVQRSRTPGQGLQCGGRSGHTREAHHPPLAEAIARVIRLTAPASAAAKAVPARVPLVTVAATHHPPAAPVAEATAAVAVKQRGRHRAFASSPDPANWDPLSEDMKKPA